MWTDPIVEETRAIRAEIAARFNFDIWALGDYFKGKRAEDAVMLINQCQAANDLEAKLHVLRRRSMNTLGNYFALPY
jgi:hypothetical protein